MFKHQINERLDLRLLHYRHAEEIYACVVRNRDHLEPWFPWVKLTTDSEAIRKFIESELYLRSVGANPYVRQEMTSCNGF